MNKWIEIVGKVLLVLTAGIIGGLAGWLLRAHKEKRTAKQSNAGKTGEKVYENAE